MLLLIFKRLSLIFFMQFCLNKWCIFNWNTWSRAQWHKSVSVVWTLLNLWTTCRYWDKFNVWLKCLELHRLQRFIPAVSWFLACWTWCLYFRSNSGPSLSSVYFSGMKLWRICISGGRSFRVYKRDYIKFWRVYSREFDIFLCLFRMFGSEIFKQRPGAS